MRARTERTEWRIEGLGCIERVFIEDRKNVVAEFFAAEPDAAHIVACVNACAGDYEVLQRHAEAGFEQAMHVTTERADALAAENDRLREVATLALHVLNPIAERERCDVDDQSPLDGLCNMLRAALAGKGGE